MKYRNDLTSNFTKELQSLIDAKELLDTILSNYNYYSGEFDRISSYDKDYGDPHSLINKIRNYTGFDDSE